MVSRLKTLTAEYRDLKARLEQGGGPDKVKRQHDQKKLTARERVGRLLDDGGPWLEVGLLVAYDQYDGQAPPPGGHSQHLNHTHHLNPTAYFSSHRLKKKINTINNREVPMD